MSLDNLLTAQLPSPSPSCHYDSAEPVRQILAADQRNRQAKAAAFTLPGLSGQAFEAAHGDVVEQRNDEDAVGSTMIGDPFE